MIVKMKIEKLTDNKIRVILKQKDFKNKNIDIQSLFLSTPKLQSLFLEILNQAKKEVNFDTDGHKLLLEVFFQSDDIFVFTITKYIDCNNKTLTPSKKYVTAKKKNCKLNTKLNIYQFKTFDDFCSFCDSINNTINLKGLFKSSILYFYNDLYFLVIKNLSLTNNSVYSIHTSLLEFAKLLSSDSNLELKLIEHGKVIMKNNAIKTGIKYFA